MSDPRTDPEANVPQTGWSRLLTAEAELLRGRKAYLPELQLCRAIFLSAAAVCDHLAAGWRDRP